MSLCWTTGRRMASIFSSEFSHFNLVIRLRNVKHLAFFQGFTCRCRCVETAGRRDWPHFLFFFVSIQAGSFFRCGFSFFLWSLVRFNCARNSGVDDVSRLQGCEMNAEGLWALSRILHAMWMHCLTSTRSPLVPYLMRAPFLGQVWVLRVPR